MSADYPARVDPTRAKPSGRDRAGVRNIPAAQGFSVIR